MTDVATTATPTEDGTIRPFRIEFPHDALDDMRRRIAATRWPERETVSDDSQGVSLTTMQALADHWATDYDWRRCESKLNALPQFMTEIDGLGHPLHPRPLPARRRPTADRHPRMAGVDHRATEDHRPA